MIMNGSWKQSWCVPIGVGMCGSRVSAHVLRVCVCECECARMCVYTTDMCAYTTYTAWQLSINITHKWAERFLKIAS